MAASFSASCGVRVGLSVAPIPVSLGMARSVHARFRAEAEHILQRDDAEVGDGVLGGPRHRPVNAVGGIAEVSQDIAALLPGKRLPPAHGGVVVVRPGVHDRVGLVTVRQINMRAGIAKAELQNPHAGNLEALAQAHERRG